jgi:hypothetical protein
LPDAEIDATVGATAPDDGGVGDPSPFWSKTDAVSVTEDATYMMVCGAVIATTEGVGVAGPAGESLHAAIARTVATRIDRFT